MCTGKEDNGDSVGIVNGSTSVITELTTGDEGSGGQCGEDVS
jgi:hypothetical protein